MISSRVKALIVLLTVLCLTLSIPAQTKATQPSTSGTITKFFIDNPEQGSGYETGPVHIIYSDGTQIIQTLPPLEKSTDKKTVFNAVGFSEVQLVDDQKTLGWTVQVQNCCTSCSIPLSVVVFLLKPSGASTVAPVFSCACRMQIRSPPPSRRCFPLSPLAVRGSARRVTG
jgi:hypothetical protein